MKRSGRNVTVATLGLLAVVLGVGGVVAPVFGWTVYSFTTTASATTAAVGTGIHDTAYLRTTADGGPYGTITFYIYSGTGCSTTGKTAVYTSSAVSVTSADQTPSTGTYTSPTVSTTGWATGNYFWVAKYSGTPGGYPSSTATCEPFNLFAGTPPPTVPEFPLGFAALMALAIPVLFLARSKFAPKATR